MQEEVQNCASTNVPRRALGRPWGRVDPAGCAGHRMQPGLDASVALQWRLGGDGHRAQNDDEASKCGDDFDGHDRVNVWMSTWLSPR